MDIRLTCGVAATEEDESVLLELPSSSDTTFFLLDLLLLR